jgi:outer membrane lipoprotein SlyB
VVDVRGEVKATATGAWAGTPMGQCIEEMIEAVRFNETQTGGSRTHVFPF